MEHVFFFFFFTNQDSCCFISKIKAASEMANQYFPISKRSQYFWPVDELNSPDTDS